MLLAGGVSPHVSLHQCFATPIESQVADITQLSFWVSLLGIRPLPKAVRLNGQADCRQKIYPCLPLQPVMGQRNGESPCEKDRARQGDE